jgi:hypothetical protein
MTSTRRSTSDPTSAGRSLGQALLVAFGLVLASATLPLPSGATTVTGATGENGASGASGDPGTPGQAGEAGESVEATEIVASGDAFAQATGGIGGRGGDGGRGLPTESPASADGGPGGNGGAGGDAVADARSANGASVEAIAQGGEGGVGGAGGFGGSSGGVPTGARGAPGISGTGGSAHATASLNAESSVTLPGSSRVSVVADATGGEGGWGRVLDGPGGTGGDATAEASGISAGDAEVSVTVTATGGLGGLALDGGRGGAGGSAMLVNSASGSTSRLLDLSVTAIGGDGGRSFTSSDGGNGGDAYVSLDQENLGGGALRITAEAAGGDGKREGAVDGQAGSATLGPVIGRSSTGADVSVTGIARAGIGSGSGAAVHLVDSVDAVTTGHIFMRQEAWGRGGDGNAGDAHSELNALKSAASLTIETEARGGFYGVLDGDATAIVDATNDAGDIFVSTRSESYGTGNSRSSATARGAGNHTTQAVAYGTNSSPSLGVNEGEVSASSSATGMGDGAVVSTASIYGGGQIETVRIDALGVSEGAGDVTVNADATLFEGTPQIQATAEGRSATGNVDVTAAIVSNGFGIENASLHDAVHGATAGRLTLVQSITSPKSISTSLVASNAGGGALDLEVSAVVRSGSSLEPRGVTLGDIIGTSKTGGDVSVRALAFGGVRQEKDDAGVASPSIIHGASNGGAVSVLASFGGGRPLPDSLGGDAPDGERLEMIGVASGTTSGDLTLEQEARAGSGGSGIASQFDPGGAGGTGGAAWSALREDVASESLTLKTTAWGGFGGQSNEGVGGRGGLATAIADGTNRAGSAALVVKATGGEGAPGRIPPFGAPLVAGGRGGDAVAEAIGTTRGDGQDILIGDFGQLDPRRRQHGARGGEGGRGIFLSRRDGTNGDGGNATSRSVGIAEGNSRVMVSDRARGGRAGFLTGGLGGIAGSGGDASSEASAFGAGSSLVMAEADAIGGDATRVFNGFLTHGGNGGDAHARSDAVGQGVVEALAISTAGKAFTGQESSGANGAAHAEARARGAQGLARASATTRSNRLAALSTTTEASAIDSLTTVAVAAHATDGLPVAGPMPLNGLSANSSLSAPSDPMGGADTAPPLLELLGSDPSAVLLAEGRWDVSHDGSTSENLMIASEFDITLTEADMGRNLLLDVFEISAYGNGFQELRMIFEISGIQVGEEQVFMSLAEALAFFEGSPFDFGSVFDASEVAQPFAAIFEATLGAGDGFAIGLGFLTAVPEPGTGLLLMLGLIVLSNRRSTTI